MDRVAVTDVPPGTVATLVVSVHPACRESWLETRDMSDTDIEAHDAALEKQEATERAAALRKVRHIECESETRPTAIWGYDRFGNPIYDNEPRADI